MHSVSSGLAGVAEFWQTRQAQNLVGREAREGSIPSTRTHFGLATVAVVVARGGGVGRYCAR